MVAKIRLQPNSALVPLGLRLAHRTAFHGRIFAFSYTDRLDTNGLPRRSSLRRTTRTLTRTWPCAGGPVIPGSPCCSCHTCISPARTTTSRGTPQCRCRAGLSAATFLRASVAGCSTTAMAHARLGVASPPSLAALPPSHLRVLAFSTASRPSFSPVHRLSVDPYKPNDLRPPPRESAALSIVRPTRRRVPHQ